MTLTDQQQSLLEFVKQAHSGQVRKYTGEPYWTHPLAVAEVVSKYDDTPGLTEIALCHDLFEDTAIQREQLKAELIRLDYSQILRIFILNGVEALTDVMTSETYPFMNRAKRKDYEAHRLSKISGHFQTVKYADLIHNTSSIVENDKGFAKKYLNEKRQMLNLMRNGNMNLFIACYKSLVDAELLLLARANA